MSTANYFAFHLTEKANSFVFSHTDKEGLFFIFTLHHAPSSKANLNSNCLLSHFSSLIHLDCMLDNASILLTCCPCFYDLSLCVKLQVADLARLSFQTTPIFIDVDDGRKKVMPLSSS